MGLDLFVVGHLLSLHGELLKCYSECVTVVIANAICRCSFGNAWASPEFSRVFFNFLLCSIVFHVVPHLYRILDISIENFGDVILAVGSNLSQEVVGGLWPLDQIYLNSTADWQGGRLYKPPRGLICTQSKLSAIYIRHSPKLPFMKCTPSYSVPLCAHLASQI